MSRSGGAQKLCRGNGPSVEMASGRSSVAQMECKVEHNRIHVTSRRVCIWLSDANNDATFVLICMKKYIGCASMFQLHKDKA